MQRKAFLSLFFTCIMLGMSAAQTKKESLILYYDMESLPAMDKSPANHGNATTVGAPTIVPGRVGNALNMPNVNGDMALNAGIWQIAGPAASVTAWVTINNSSDQFYMKVFSCKRSFTDPNGFEVQYNPSMKQFVLIGSGTTQLVQSAPNVELVAGRWYHVAMVANNNVGAIYLDGVNISNTTALNPIKANAGKEVLIGSSELITNAGGAWRGQLDEVRVYSVALTAADVLAIIAEAPALPTDSSSSSSSSDTNVASNTDSNVSNSDSNSATDSATDSGIISSDSSSADESNSSDSATSEESSSSSSDVISTSQDVQPTDEEGSASQVALSAVVLIAAGSLLL